MNPYDRFTVSGHQHRRFFEELRQWHDEMVLHQRHVRRVGPGAACSDECPHAQGRRLWTEATALLGADAHNLTFLRASAGSAAPRRDGPRAPRCRAARPIA